MSMARGPLLFEAWPYYVEQEDDRILLTVQAESIGTNIILAVPDENVGKDFTQLLQSKRLNRALIENTEV